MVGDGSHEEIRSFFFVSVGSGSELFFLTAQLDVFQSNSKWNGDTSFYFPPQLKHIFNNEGIHVAMRDLMVKVCVCGGVRFGKPDTLIQLDLVNQIL
jgi:hypothetical protein